MSALPGHICLVSIIHTLYCSKIDLYHTRAHLRGLNIKKLRLQSPCIRFLWSCPLPGSHFCNSIPFQKTTQRITFSMFLAAAVIGYRSLLDGFHSVCSCLNEKMKHSSEPRPQRERFVWSQSTNKTEKQLPLTFSWRDSVILCALSRIVESQFERYKVTTVL